MKFKKLEVAGFKSFADRLEVKFGSGVTAIVGPNGCGKSNVADSIRWVLGEQSAKLLRGASMQDVIFNGTENRKSLSFCEVNLYFDNTEKLFPSLDYSEVVITRKLYRSGESEYCLNKNQCRLKDITDLLRDSGMGREGYSIIGQGRIDELLSAKPEDRRAIFEEAAGISKFKARKVDAERKLGRTRENLIRINDILEEKAKMLEPLTRQSEAAKKWLDLRDKLRNLEINMYIHQYDTTNQAKDAINSRLSGIEEETKLRQQEHDSATEKYNDSMANVNNVDKLIETLREQLLNLTVGLEKQAGEAKLQTERINNYRMQSERLQSENARLTDEFNITMSYIEEGTQSRDEKAGELNLKRREYEKLNEQYLETVETLTQGEGEVDSHNRAVMEAMDKLTDIKSNMSRLIAEREALGGSIEDLKKRLTVTCERLEENSARAEELKGEISEFAEDKKNISAQLEKQIAINNDCTAQINSAATELDSISAEFYSAESKHKLLVEMQRSYEGFAYSVKNLINDSKKDKNLSSRIEGVVASLISVNEGFEVAVEMALGAAVQNIVTNTEEDAKFLIEYLKRARYGRVTFLPISAIKARSLDYAQKQLLDIKGCFGVATSLIKFDEKYSGIFGGLLGNTVIVDNMDTAILLARKARYAFKIVTLEGDIINPHGSITGGSKKSELTNIFAYDKEISELAPRLAQMQSRLDKLNALRTEKSQIQKAAESSIKDMRDKIHLLEVEMAAKSESYNKLTSNIVDLSEEIENLKGEEEHARARANAIDSDLNSVGELEQLVTGKKTSASESGLEQKQIFDALRKERDKLHEQMTNARIACTTLDSKVNSLDSDIRRLQSNIVGITEKIDANSAQITQTDETISSMEDELKTQTLIGKDSDSENVRGIREKLGDLDTYKQDMQSAMAGADKLRQELSEQLNLLHDKNSQEKMQLLKVDSDLDILQQRVLEEYDLNYELCLQFKDSEFEVNRAMTDINRLKRQMSSLGNINVDSIEQCKELYAGYNDMDIQREDLVKGENDLLKIIKELSGEMMGRFATQFEQIRINFVKIFKELFDGGTADLILQESENPLEAGIEIVAQPPQKKLQSISLLSGGERALTAIAILFAILRLKPMPFCVLDEIEAALDDANAGRFAKYLRRFAEETQFIVITHRKPTMELADSLYGVTMEEKGVSKIVSVKLSDAVAFDGAHAK